MFPKHFLNRTGDHQCAQITVHNQWNQECHGTTLETSPNNKTSPTKKGGHQNDQKQKAKENKTLDTVALWLLLKQKTRLHTPFLCHYSPLNLVFFCFSGFSRFLLLLGQKQKPRDNKNNNKNKRGAVAESWVLSFCFFGVFFPQFFGKPTEDNRSGSSGRRFVKNNMFSSKNRLLRLEQLVNNIGAIFFWKSRAFLRACASFQKGHWNGTEAEKWDAGGCSDNFWHL